MISCFSQLSSGLSAYPWGSIINLAWFSFVTHLTTLTMLRTHLQKNPPQRAWRLVWMTILAIMLICGLWSTGYLDWYHGPFMFGFPAWCLFHWPDSMSDYEQNYNTLSVGLSVPLLSVSYFARGAVISSAASSWLERNLSRMPRVIIERYLRRLHQKIMARSNSQTRLLSVFTTKSFVRCSCCS